jgi:hypothetical protein
VGAGVPTIFFNDMLPLTLALALAVLEAGNSGNNDWDNFGGVTICFSAAAIAIDPGPELEIVDSRPDATGAPVRDEGPRTPEAVFDAHGVFRGA